MRCRDAAGLLVSVILLVTTSGCLERTTTTTTTTTSTVSSTSLTTTISPDATPPSIPTGLTASAATCGQINLAWNASTDAGSRLRAYNVYRNGSFLKQVVAPATSTGDTGLAAATVYSYAVTAIDNTGNASGPSVPASANTPACPDTIPPSVPTGVRATAVGCSGSELAWSASTDTGGSQLRGYNVYRNGSFLKQVLAPSASTSDAGLAASTTYSYRVAAVDNAGNISPLSTPGSTTTAPSPSVDLGLVGFVPGVGTPYDVAVDDATGLAYAASAEFGLSVVDVSSPSAPVAIGAANPAFFGQRVAAAGGLAVVSGGSLGMKVVDLTVPTAPQTVGALSANVSAVALVDRTAYALVVVPGNPAHVDLGVVSLGTPASPTIVGRLTLPVGGSDLEVVGSLAYVTAGSGGLQIVDVGNPTAPAVIAVLDTPGIAAGVAVANGYAYVADGTTVRVIDVARPSQPRAIGSLATSASAVALAGSRLYAVDGLQFKVIDVTTPTAPVLLSSTNGYGASRLDVSGTIAFLASSNITPSQGGLYVWGVAAPTAPTVLAGIDDAFDSRGVAVAGPLAVSAGGSRGMKIIDLANRTAPRVVGSLAGMAVGVGLAGQTAYALLLVPGNPARVDLAVVSLATPSAPTIVGRITLGTGGADIEVVGSLAYVAAGGNGLQIVSVASPTVPTLVRTVDTPGTASGVAIANGYAYLADGTAIQVVDVAPPSQAAIVGSLATSASAIAVAGNRLYAVDGLQLKVIDVTSPTAPVLLSATTGYGAQGVEASGTVAYLATPALNHTDTGGSVRALDVSVPTAPRLLQQLVVPGLTRTLTSDATFLYAGDANSIVDVISVGP